MPQTESISMQNAAEFTPESTPDHKYTYLNQLVKVLRRKGRYLFMSECLYFFGH
ncbi:hypothetical protein [Evansella clarkii]|uniref:hypothetical protein n=1 Tax=Evansella clarkii TaxID=79879 RepID=UPI001473EAF6|nr:hypothetical protein [Evansella clarkii]